MTPTWNLIFLQLAGGSDNAVRTVEVGSVGVLCLFLFCYTVIRSIAARSNMTITGAGSIDHTTSSPQTVSILASAFLLPVCDDNNDLFVCV